MIYAIDSGYKNWKSLNNDIEEISITKFLDSSENYVKTDDYVLFIVHNSEPSPSESSKFKKELLKRQKKYRCNAMFVKTGGFTNAREGKIGIFHESTISFQNSGTGDLSHLKENFQILYNSLSDISNELNDSNNNKRLDAWKIFESRSDLKNDFYYKTNITNLQKELNNNDDNKGNKIILALRYEDTLPDLFENKHLIIISEMLKDGDPNSRSKFIGYQWLFEQISKKENRNKFPLSVTYISSLKRKELGLVTFFSTSLVPIFDHYTFNDFDISKLTEFKSIRKRFIPNYVLSKTGAYDLMLHKIRDISISTEVTSEELITFNSQMESFNEIFDLGLDDILIELKTKKLPSNQSTSKSELKIERNENDQELTSSYLKKLANKVFSLSESNKQSLQIMHKRTVEDANLYSHVIILEDNKTLRAEIEKTLKLYFKEVYSFSTSVEALQHIEENKYQVNCLFCDLELLDKNGWWQKEQGYEILEFIEEKYPHIYSLALTTYSKQAMTVLDLKARYLYKDPNTVFPSHFDLEDEFGKIEKNSLANTHQYISHPKGGFWTGQHNYLHLYYKFHSIKLWKEVYNKADELCKNISTTEKIEIPSRKKDHKATRDSLINVLAVRLWYLSWNIYQDYKSSPLSFNGFAIDSKSKNQISQLGLENSTGTIHRLNLFYEEYIWLQKNSSNNYLKKLPQENREIFIFTHQLCIESENNEMIEQFERFYTEINEVNIKFNTYISCLLFYLNWLYKNDSFEKSSLKSMKKYIKSVKTKNDYYEDDFIEIRHSYEDKNTELLKYKNISTLINVFFNKRKNQYDITFLEIFNLIESKIAKLIKYYR